MFQIQHHMSHLDPIRTQVRTLNHLFQFHAQITLHSLHAHNYYLTTLLTLCTRLRAPTRYACALFQSAVDPNEHVFTTMLKFHSQLGAVDEVVALFGRMRGSGVRPDAFVFPILIKSVGFEVDGVHAHVVKVGCECDQFVRNAVMDGYAKKGWVGVARKVFDGIPDRAVADWNSMVSAYWRCGDAKEAQGLFNLIPKRNVVSWTAMVTGYTRTGDLVKAREFFDLMPERNVVSWNAMLSGYTQNGFSKEALWLFDRMLDTGVNPNEKTWATVISACASKADLNFAESLVGLLRERKVRLNCYIKTALVDMYAKCRNMTKAWEIFNGMNDKNTFSWNTIISGYAREGNLELARKLFDTMPEKNVISWNSMISGYVQNGKWLSAIELFKLMIDLKESNPDEVTMVSIISACGHIGALEIGKWSSTFIFEKSIKPTISLYNSLIFMYSRCGHMNGAKDVFEEMKTRDVFSYNSLITGLATQGQGFEALALMERMKKEGIHPDRITFIGILTACSHAGLSEEGQRVFDEIPNPTVDHYACMVDLLARAARLDEAKKLIDEMPMVPHAGVYGSLLNASRIHKRVDLGVFAAHKLFDLEPNNSGNYVLLGNIYASLKKWEDVERVRSMMRWRGVSKTTGCSWVEYKGKMLQFIAGDRSNARFDEIKKLLGCLRKKLREMGYMADKNCVFRDVEEEDKEEMVGAHSEKLAVTFSLLAMEGGEVIRIVKNLRICEDCHVFMKMLSELEGREIMVRDNNRFHCFKDGSCSCKDYW